MTISNISPSAFAGLFLLVFFMSLLTNLAQETTALKNLNSNWFLHSSENLKDGGEIISSQSYSTKDWYKTDIPKTVLAALVDNGVYKNPYFGKNILDIPQETFEKPWWYRKEFIIDDVNESTFYELTLEGINYKAELWLNGKMIAGEDLIEGAYGIFNFDISGRVEKGVNVIAIKIIPPKPGDLTIGFVDWNPTPPDKMMGLWRGVKLKKTNIVSIDDVFVQTKLNDTFKQAELVISGEMKNYSNKKVEVDLVGEITGGIKFTKHYSLEAHETKKVIVTSNDEKSLLINNPKLWYPNNLGQPDMYDLSLKVELGDTVSDIENVRFGIRKVEDFINEEGFRGYKVNGKKVLIKGAGWVDDMMLNDSDEKVKAEVEYVKQMNLNTIRLEGFWGKNETLYDAADENGILIIAGWSCQWEWKNYCGREETKYMCINSSKDVELHTKQYNQQVKWLRNHPSILVWVFGSDKYPSPEVEAKLKSYLAESDPSRPTLLSCQNIKVDPSENQNNIYEDSRVKMYGPYEYEPPVYWYVDTQHGGAYGFNTETGPGPQVPPIESIKKMLPEENLWPVDSMWDFHCGRNEFDKLDRYLNAFNHRYGQASTLEEFAEKSQMSNYEAMRPMFEAFEVNKFSSTGVVQWMLNSAWPEMYWQLFDYYLMPNGAFYGAMKGNQPLNLVYNYKDKDIYLVNDFNKSFDKLNASVKVFDANSQLLYEKEAVIGVGENCSEKIFDMPDIHPPTNLFFVSLELKDNSGSVISDNFYWLSKIEDELNFEKSEWFFTPIKSFGDLKEINTLPKTTISYNENFIKENGDDVVEVVLKNDSDKLAFFIELKIVNKDTGESILPIFWSDNYVSLIPNSTKKVKGRFKNSNGKLKPKLVVKGWNVHIQNK